MISDYKYLSRITMATDQIVPIEGAGTLQSIERPDLNHPKWDQSTYGGRARHFFAVTNPLNVLLSGKQLEEAKRLVTLYR